MNNNHNLEHLVKLDIIRIFNYLSYDQNKEICYFSAPTYFKNKNTPSPPFYGLIQSKISEYQYLEIQRMLRVANYFKTSYLSNQTKKCYNARI